MKNRLAAVLAVAVLFSVCAWAQSDSVADAAQQNQKKKASHVIDDENLGSALANSGDVQNASASSGTEAGTEKKNPNFVDDDGNPLTAREQVERRKGDVGRWLEAIERSKKSLENAQTEAERKTWKENIANDEKLLAETRKELAEAEAALAREQNPQSQGDDQAAPAPVDNAPEQGGAGSTAPVAGATPPEAGAAPTQ